MSHERSSLHMIELLSMTLVNGHLESSVQGQDEVLRWPHGLSINFSHQDIIIWRQGPSQAEEAHFLVNRNVSYCRGVPDITTVIVL